MPGPESTVENVLHCIICQSDCFDRHVFHQRSGPMCHTCSEKRLGNWSAPKWTKGRRRVEVWQGRVRVILDTDSGMFRALIDTASYTAIPIEAVRILLRAVEGGDSEEGSGDVRDELFPESFAPSPRSLGSET